MKILVSGATGFIGRHLCQRLLRDGHEVTAWVRDPNKAVSQLGCEVNILGGASNYLLPDTGVDEFDAIVNLAGAPVAGVRWSAARKKQILDSRVRTTEALVAAINRSPTPPQVLFSTSGIGFYGYGDPKEVFTESSDAGNDFLSRVTQAWEAAANQTANGCRLVIGRIGLVLGLDEGILGKLTPIFETGLGGVMGSGRQGMSWVHIYDLVDFIAHALLNERTEGVYNCVAPNPVSHRQFCKTFAKTLGRPCLFKIPGLALKTALGEASEMVLQGAVVTTERTDATGFSYSFAHLGGALEHLFEKKNGPVIQASKQKSGHFSIRDSTRVQAPFETVRPFFFFPKSLSILSPPASRMEFLYGHESEMREGHEMAFRVQLGPLTQTWTAIIEENTPDYFVDTQAKGPMSSWHHKHRFIAQDWGTEISDEVQFRMPLGPLGRFALKLFAGEMIRRLFVYRKHMMKIRFGVAASGDQS